MLWPYEVYGIEKREAAERYRGECPYDNVHGTGITSTMAISSQQCKPHESNHAAGKWIFCLGAKHMAESRNMGGKLQCQCDLQGTKLL